MDMGSFFGWLLQRCLTNCKKQNQISGFFSLVPPFPATSPWGPVSKKLSCQNWLRHHLTHSFWMRSLALRPLNGMIGLQTPKQLRQVHPIADLSTGLVKNWDHYCVPLQLSEIARSHGMVALVGSGEHLVTALWLLPILPNPHPPQPGWDANLVPLKTLQHCRLPPLPQASEIATPPHLCPLPRVGKLLFWQRGARDRTVFVEQQPMSAAGPQPLANNLLCSPVAATPLLRESPP